MNIKRKIKAFTLIDTLTAVVISSIIVTAAYYFIGFIQESQYSFNNGISQTYQIQKVKDKINYFCLKSDSIKADGDALTFYIKEEKVFVDVTNSYLLIDDGLKDSLFWSLNNTEFEQISNNSKIKTFNFAFDYDGLPFEWFFYKEYGELVK